MRGRIVRLQPDRLSVSPPTRHTPDRLKRAAAAWTLRLTTHALVLGFITTGVVAADVTDGAQLVAAVERYDRLLAIGNP